MIRLKPRSLCIRDTKLFELPFYETIRSIDFSLNPYNFDHEITWKHKRMKIWHISEICFDGNEEKNPERFLPRLLVRPDPKSSRWHLSYIENPSPNIHDEFHREEIDFRNLFRVPFMFIELYYQNGFLRGI